MRSRSFKLGISISISLTCLSSPASLCPCSLFCLFLLCLGCSLFTGLWSVICIIGHKDLCLEHQLFTLLSLRSSTLGLLPIPLAAWPGPTFCPTLNSNKPCCRIWSLLVLLWSSSWSLTSHFSEGCSKERECRRCSTVKIGYFSPLSMIGWTQLLPRKEWRTTITFCYKKSNH